ncbi:PP2C family protein-serine/threonine phosphatase [Saccharothrix texasensis]|uniref:Sigma-B regulation protein RsbU (Phosphoserine phosphatase) n=1 Tax=Saccharothrix texasensis TaxID=103734 RepID=A0A3N1GY80_9PSEU|nr:PP2C family protein-serine/threonine phosphatase [Saccharothrix texasensis]ROP35187.1 sigma-B regulation protein RsbU (phosphoserine phosphatase) [Saccharothrix texasensis]
MVPATALVVGRTADVRPDLVHAVRGAGLRVRSVAAADLESDPSLAGRPDVVLLSASLGLRRVALLSGRLAETGARRSALVFADGDLTALETCVRAGFDYLTPPYSSSLVRGRLTAAWERGELVGAVELLAVESTVREYERDLSLTHDLQAGFLPESLPRPSGWELAARLRPARLVSGDFYDAFELSDGRLGFVVADVCDKGLSAALFVALIRTLVRHTAERFPDDPWQDGAGPLVHAVVDTNRYLARNHLRQGYFATMFFGVLDPRSGSLLYINCGHLPPELARADGTRASLPPTGPAIGLLPDSEYHLGHAVLLPGDVLLAYTDGVVEARDLYGGQFGREALMAAVVPGRSAAALLDGVDEALRGHVDGAEQSDDITMLALRRQGVPDDAAGPAGS